MFLFVFIVLTLSLFDFRYCFYCNSLINKRKPPGVFLFYQFTFIIIFVNIFHVNILQYVWVEDEMDAVYNIEALYNCIKEHLQQSTEEIKYTLHPRPAGYGLFPK